MRNERDDARRDSEVNRSALQILQDQLESRDRNR
jgi:hypothetical protein